SGVNNILVLEANKRVGGRLYTKRDEKVKWVDLGGAYIGPNQENIRRIASELGVDIYKVHVDGYLLDYDEGKRTAFEADGIPYHANNFLESFELQRFFQKLDEMGSKFPAEAPWRCPYSEEWDRITFKEFIDKSLWTKKARKMAYLMANDILTAAPHEVSLLFALWYIKMGKGTNSIFSNVNGAQDSKFDGGSMQICEKLAEAIGNHRVQLNKAIYSVDQTSSYVSVKTVDCFEYKARYIILSFAPCMQAKIHYSPPLPPLRNQMLQRFPMGSVIKCIVYYETAFWREKGYCGAATDEDFDNHLLSITLDDSKRDGSYPAIIGFATATRNRQLCELSREERKIRICESFAELFDSQEALWPVHYEEYDWNCDQYAGGGYTGICPPGFLTEFGKIIRKPVRNMYFAGTETATEWFGYMEGGVQAGERAAREVLHAMKVTPVREVWKQSKVAKIEKKSLFSLTDIMKQLTLRNSVKYVSSFVFGK
ncbi:Amine oxidase [flavin-containing] B-like protein, partial [Dinothrombium tinctorium]